MGLLDRFPKSPLKKTGWPWTEEVCSDLYIYKSSWPKISIVTPSFNQGQFIEETIRSVLLQNYPNLEYIIIDGGSTDETTDIIKKYEGWISYWVSEADKGQSHAINKGIQKCTGELFAWLNSDDFYEKNTLRKVANEYKTNNPDFITGGLKVLSTHGVSKLSPTSLLKCIPSTIGFCELKQPSSFWKLDLFNTLNLLNEDLNYMMDQEFWIRYLITYNDKVKLARIQTPLTNFRIHSNSKTDSSKIDFHDEKAQIFYSIAYFTKSKLYQEKMKGISSNEMTPMKTLNLNGLSKIKNDKIFNYYFLRQLRRSMHHNEHSLSKLYSSLISFRHLYLGDSIRLVKDLMFN